MAKLIHQFLCAILPWHLGSDWRVSSRMDRSDLYKRTSLCHCCEGINNSRLNQRECWQTNGSCLLSRGMHKKFNGFKQSVRPCFGCCWRSSFRDRCPALHILGQWSHPRVSQESLGRSGRGAQALHSKLSSATTQGCITPTELEHTWLQSWLHPRISLTLWTSFMPAQHWLKRSIIFWSLRRIPCRTFWCWQSNHRLEIEETYLFGEAAFYGIAMIKPYGFDF